MRHCPDCRNHVKSFEEFCPKCGADLNQVKLAQSKKKLTVLFWTFY
jgi:predicted amidophosphoribosyltransferase